MKRRNYLAGVLVAVIAVLFVLWRLDDHDLSQRRSQPFDFHHSGHQIAGTLWLPAGPPRVGVILVHGDGPQDRSSAGGYAPMINSFLDQGIAVASWDKPGVGGSGGNWLHQSMAERTAEAQAALRLLHQRLEGVTIGAVGFSQAGWVLPALTPQDADFLVLIGPAVSWQEQGQYYARRRLTGEGLSSGAVEQAIRHQALAEEKAFAQGTLPPDPTGKLTPERWRFLRENRHSDAREALARLDLPLFAVWGAGDLNVDAARDAATYRRLVADRHAATQIILWPEATHGLLRAAPYNWQLVENWSWLAKLRFLLEGRHAYAPGFLTVLTTWITARGQSTASDG